MTDESDKLDFGKPIDDDYIGVEKRRADVSTAEDSHDDDICRSPRAAEHADMSHAFDDGDGSGASSRTDELIDDNAIIEHDGRASTRTFFYPEQAAEQHRDRYYRMLQYQEDKWSGMKNAQRRADRMRTVGNFCGQLDMSTYHRNRVTEVMDSIEMSHMAHYSSPLVILAIISLVANADGRFIRDETQFRNLMRDIDTSLNELKNVRELVRKKSDIL
jgi:hypothetical protein